MAKIRQPYPEERFVPWIGTNVKPGAVVEVPDGDLPSYLEAGWEPADTATKKAAADLARAAQQYAEKLGLAAGLAEGSAARLGAAANVKEA